MQFSEDKMNSKDLGRAILMVVLIGALILLAVDKRVMADEGSSAQIVSDEPPGTGLSEGQPEIQSEIRAPAAGGSGIYTSSGLEFWPYMSSTTFARYGVGICNTSVDSRNFETQLHLPHGVTIQQVVVYFYDNDSTNNLYADFNYHPYTNWGTYIFTELNSFGASPEVRYISATPPAPYNYVDSALREYTVEVLLPPSCSVILLSVRVDYSYTSYLPAVMK